METPPDGFGAVLEVDLGAIAENWRALSARHPAGPVAGVVKADGYGLGAAPVAAALHEAGCRHFFVAHPGEALAIRDRVPGALLGVLNGLLPGSAAAMIAHDIAPVLGSLDEIDAWTAAARTAGRTLPALLHVDTGMARLGLTPAQVEALAAAPGRLAGIDLRYVMTHLVSAEVPDDPMNAAQRDRFAAACALLPAAPRSFANSSGIFLGPDFASDLARPGAALYGVNPTPGQPNPMRVAVRLMARVLQVRDVPAGAPVGYNATWTAARASRIATACIGYADGWLRSQSGRGMARFDGQAVPLVGRVSMDLTTYDATDHPGLQAGAWLELICPDHSPDQVAEAAGTNGYEVLTALGRRFHRRYRPA
jgi:alanine racemase